MRENELELARLAGSELDDQAIAEILTLLNREVQTDVLGLADLLRLASNGPLLVARRSCGLYPEIVGVAGLTLDDQGGLQRLVAVDPAYGGQDLIRSLRAWLRDFRPQASLFRGPDRAPLGLRATA